jgi:cellulose synthase operon protein C
VIVRVLGFLALLGGGAAPALAGRVESMRYVVAADAAFVQGQPRSARIQLMNATDADPKNALAWMYQARVALALDDARGAEDALDRAIDAGYPLARTQHLRAHALILEHRPADALAAAKADRVAAPYRGYAARMRGRALADLGDFGGAAREFGAAMAITPRSVGLWVDLARFRLLTGERLGAIRASDQAVALDHDNVEALVLKGMLVRDQYGLAAALAWFDKALAIDRFDLDAQLERAATLGDMGRTSEMLAVTRAVQALDPANPRAFYLQAVLAARARNFKLADKLIDQVGGALDDMPAMLLLKGSVAYQLGSFSEATDALSDLVESQPANIAARRLLAAAQWQSGNAAAVLATLAPMADAPDADGYALTLAGRAYEAQGDRETAARYFDRAAHYRAAPVQDALLPTIVADDDQAGGDAAAKVAQVHALLAAGDIHQGLAMALAIQRDNPGAPDAHLLAGDAWSAAGQAGRAIDAYRRAANLKFSEAAALRMIGALNRAGRLPDAVRVLDLFLSQNPISVRGRVLQADLLMARGRFGEAANVLEALEKRLGGRDVAVASNLAWCYFRTDRVDQALEAAAQAYRLAPGNPRLSHSYGWILYKSGRNPRGALALLQQAAAQAPDWGLARAHLAEAVHDAASIS